MFCKTAALFISRSAGILMVAKMIPVFSILRARVLRVILICMESGKVLLTPHAAKFSVC